MGKEKKSVHGCRHVIVGSKHGLNHFVVLLLLTHKNETQDCRHTHTIGLKLTVQFIFFSSFFSSFYKITF